MTKNSDFPPDSDIFQQLPEAEALERIRHVADTRWKINRCLKIFETLGLQLEDSQMPPIDYQILAEALDWLTTLFQQQGQDGRFAHGIMRLGIMLRKIQHEQRQLELHWRILGWQLQKLASESLPALYYNVPSLKKEVDEVSARLQPLHEAKVDLSI
ncbi:MAG: hypothetical protein BZ151_01335 [Desulfobacca sp. 4484_104]|nr:MAG: hypothetical protein BZ151_01335 [Desulfobacca sp. 4484_104]RLA88865.1 MAG: hypothetical protein DRG58_06785 [Deltaproteobacteria bacterium]